MKRKQLGFLIVVLLAISIIAHGDSGDEHGAGGVEELIKSWMANRHIIWLFAIIAVTIYTLGKGADWLVEEAVTLSTRWGVPTTLVGATIVSMGTTMPEAAVSVLAAVKGSPGLALGNAVGSIICDTGLVLGTAALIAPLPLNRMIVNRQGWLQLGAGFLLVLACIPYDSLGTVFSGGGKLPQFMGFVFLVLLVAYMWQSIRWARHQDSETPVEEDVEEETGTANMFFVVAKLLFAIVVVVASAWILIPAVEEVALRLKVPEPVVAATLVAFGTSLPEFVTAVTAARKGHGALAVGNVIGADILNVLFVAGASAAVTRDGLAAIPRFFQLTFPMMLFILLVFRVGIFTSGDRLKRPFGFILLGTYVLVTVLSYIIR